MVFLLFRAWRIRWLKKLGLSQRHSYKSPKTNCNFIVFCYYKNLYERWSNHDFFFRTCNVICPQLIHTLIKQLKLSRKRMFLTYVWSSLIPKLVLYHINRRLYKKNLKNISEAFFVPTEKSLTLIGGGIPAI